MVEIGIQLELETFEDETICCLRKALRSLVEPRLTREAGVGSSSRLFGTEGSRECSSAMFSVSIVTNEVRTEYLLVEMLEVIGLLRDDMDKRHGKPEESPI